MLDVLLGTELVVEGGIEVEFVLEVGDILEVVDEVVVVCFEPLLRVREVFLSLWPARSSQSFQSLCL